MAMPPPYMAVFWLKLQLTRETVAEEMAMAPPLPAGRSDNGAGQGWSTSRSKGACRRGENKEGVARAEQAGVGGGSRWQPWVQG